MNWIENSNSSIWYMDMLKEPSFWLGTLILIVIAYLIGSINGGQILSRIGSKNLGDEGSKNYGATNAGRVYGAKGFIAVFLFDMSKAIVAAIIMFAIVSKGTFNSISDTSYLFYYSSIPLAMVFVIIGHSWPLFFGFKGGKGVATSFGTVIVLNWLFAIIAITIFIIVVLITRWTSWGSIIGTTAGCLMIIFFHPLIMTTSFGEAVFFSWTYNWITLASTAFVGILVVLRHRSNIIRMIEGKDPFIKPKGYKKEDNNESKS